MTRRIISFLLRKRVKLAINGSPIHWGVAIFTEYFSSLVLRYKLYLSNHSLYHFPQPFYCNIFFTLMANISIAREVLLRGTFAVVSNFASSIVLSEERNFILKVCFCTSWLHEGLFGMFCLSQPFLPHINLYY